ncbi:VapC toxin family PIN domain ribonuclease [Marispirochaeta aestuarii]|uniref:Ribonuclease VapC n=1 Tax=Marispirochaeta aestuarii TaxID=1963862 RepID=A0A1Y1S1R3_9SPIO|nr:TA system VapC family ribonuclease toxin [Marispirochaeta aestuarii]ORC37754.1 VapC toxin family PIN domain ribonuclease [Marispirochaeta aestuarii]
MILIDADLLIYASMKSSSSHAGAKEWLDGKLNGNAPVGIPWESMLAFLRSVTNPRIFSPPVSPEEAWKVIRYWTSCKPVWIPQATENHLSILENIYRSIKPAANLVPDAHLAALSMEHGLTLCSTDGDFARFPKLSWVNPLA